MLKSLYHDQRKALTQQELNAVLLAHDRFLAYQHGATRAELARTKLDGLNLANHNLAEADFSFASMIGATAFGSNFDRANLQCADLRDSDFSSARLVRADLRGTSICGARFVFARLDKADLRAATVAYRGPSAANGTGEKKTVHVDFSNSSLKGVSFDDARLDGVDFTGAILEGASFKNAQLSNVNFRNAVLVGVNLAELAVPLEALDGCVTDVTPEAAARAGMLAAKLKAHQLCMASGGAQGARATLDGEDLRPVSKLLAGRQLTGLLARRANAIGIDFSRCQLQGARFDGSDLRGCNFSNADLRGASFKGARLGHAEFDKANLGSLRLPGRETLAPEFTGADAIQSQFFMSNLETTMTALGLGVSEFAAE